MRLPNGFFALKRFPKSLSVFFSFIIQYIDVGVKRYFGDTMIILLSTLVRHSKIVQVW